jgi:Zn-dependent protease
VFIETFATDPKRFFAVLITVVVSICIHELAHGVVAVWLGDRTPIEQDRVTLNPLVHMGPFSIITLLLAGIAWGSMPVDRSRLRGRYAVALVAAAGPASNVLLSLLALGSLALWMRFDPAAAGDRIDNAQFLLEVFGRINMLLALFNLLPVPPLDGSSILGNLSSAYDRTVNGFFARSPGAVMPALLLVFIVSGHLIRPAADSLSVRFFRFVSGF